MTVLGCAPDAPTVTVRVVSGLRAGDEVAVLDAVLSDGASCSRSGSAVSRAVSTDDQGAFAAGTLEMPAFVGVAPGVHSILLTAQRRSGASLASLVWRCVVVNVVHDRVVRIPLSASCVGVECPAPGGSPELSECLHGRCVSPRCDPEDPATRELCCDRAALGGACDDRPTPCTADGDCSAGPSCSLAPICSAGICVEPEADACPGGEYCDAAADRCVTRGMPRSDAGPTDAGSIDAGPTDASSDTGVPRPREDCVRIGDEDLDGAADCADTDCAARAICVAACAPRAATPAPPEAIPTPSHWYRADLSVVRAPSGDVCALEDLVGGEPLLADPSTMPILGVMNDEASSPAIELDVDAWLLASGTFLGVDRDGDYAMFVVFQDAAPAGSYRPFTAGTLAGSTFDVVALGLHHELASPWTRSVVAHGAVLGAGAGEGTFPRVVRVLAAGTPPGVDIASRLDYRLGEEQLGLTGSGIVPARAGTGEPAVRVGPAQLGGRFLLAELITYDRCLGGPETELVWAYLRTRYLFLL